MSSKTIFRINSGVAAAVWSSLQHTTKLTKFSITLRCRGCTAVTRAVDIDGVDSGGCVKGQLHSVADDGLVVRKLLIKIGLPIALVTDKLAVAHEEHLPENICTPTVALAP